MKTKHTPGPWQVSESRGKYGLTTMIYPAEGGGGCIASIDAQLDSALTEGANARLIAAAPEMLELLDQICAELYVVELNGIKNEPNLGLIFNRASQLIAKARGEE